MSSPSSPSPSMSPSSPQAPRRRRLRGGYVASLVSAVVTLVVFGVLLALGPWVRHPAPDFISEVGTNLEAQLEVDEEDLDVIGVYGLSFDGICSFTTPSGTPGMSERRHVRSVDYGAEEWHLVQTLEVTESGTYDISCDNRKTEFGLASTYVSDSAGRRQFTWAITWITLPVLGLATTVTIAVVTRRRDRQEKAAASGRH
ncbi:hypothetical protein [Nocardiopsis tropica]|uniref:Uncharacterized protein n=1 Tax=Nocardiopsis tropica TaxID=109330 RepID=A0ABU7KI42_9ACTN|nr:hypothetical protein [Nocardiopsis umidischolae]MEE2048961.1 hypothetical protein [Nocardiopsis umidischolae]